MSGHTDSDSRALRRAKIESERVEEAEDALIHYLAYCDQVLQIQWHDAPVSQTEETLSVKKWAWLVAASLQEGKTLTGSILFERNVSESLLDIQATALFSWKPDHTIGPGVFLDLIQIEPTGFQSQTLKYDPKSIPKSIPKTRDPILDEYLVSIDYYTWTEHFKKGMSHRIPGYDPSEL